MAIPFRSAQNPAVNWRDFTPEGIPQGADVQVPYRSPNTPEATPMSGNPSTGGISPSPDTSALYALYNKRNPYSAEADRYSQMAGKDMGGRLGQLPGIVATYMGAKASKKSREFEESRSKKADELIAKKEAWDKIEGDRKEQARQLDIFEKEIGPEVMQAYAQKYKETGDLDVSSEYAAALANKRNKEKGLSSMPNFTKITGWDEGVVTMLWDDKLGKPVQGRIDKYGNLGKMNEKNQFIPADSKDMLLSAYENRQRTEAAQTRADNTGADITKDPFLNVLTSRLSSLDRKAANSFEGLSEIDEKERSAVRDLLNQKMGLNPNLQVTSWEDGKNPPPGVFKRSSNTGSGGQAQPSAQPSPQAAAPQYANKEAVVLAKKEGKLTYEQAAQILSTQFGLK